MSTKLTLSVDKEVISKAKKIASEQGVSLSLLVENFLRNLKSETEEDILLNPVLRKLSGSVQVPDDFDYKKELAIALSEKYLK